MNAGQWESRVPYFLKQCGVSGEGLDCSCSPPPPIIAIHLALPLLLLGHNSVNANLEATHRALWGEISGPTVFPLLQQHLFFSFLQSVLFSVHMSRGGCPCPHWASSPWSCEFCWSPQCSCNQAGSLPVQHSYQLLAVNQLLSFSLILLFSPLAAWFLVLFRNVEERAMVHLVPWRPPHKATQGKPRGSLGKIYLCGAHL